MVHMLPHMQPTSSRCSCSLDAVQQSASKASAQMIQGLAPVKICSKPPQPTKVPVKQAACWQVGECNGKCSPQVRVLT